jgi:cystathionine gamma-synthase
MHSSTQAVHAGEERRKPHEALTTPVVQTPTYIFEDVAEFTAFTGRKTARDNGADVALRNE